MRLFKKSEPQNVQVKGYDLVCPVCTCRLFWTRKAQLNRALTTFFGIDATDRSATCSQSVLIYWFLG